MSQVTSHASTPTPASSPQQFAFSIWVFALLTLATNKHPLSKLHSFSLRLPTTFHSRHQTGNYHTASSPPTLQTTSARKPSAWFHASSRFPRRVTSRTAAQRHAAAGWTSIAFTLLAAKGWHHTRRYMKLISLSHSNNVVQEKPQEIKNMEVNKAIVWIGWCKSKVLVKVEENFGGDRIEGYARLWSISLYCFKIGSK